MYLRNFCITGEVNRVQIDSNESQNCGQMAVCYHRANKLGLWRAPTCAWYTLGCGGSRPIVGCAPHGTDIAVTTLIECAGSGRNAVHSQARDRTDL